MIAQHSSKNDSWMTPPDIVSRVHQVFGGPPDLDPASSPSANALLQAKKILTREDDALSVDWPTCRTVFCNPPGGKIGNKSQPALFWQKFQGEFLGDKFQAGIFLGFTLELLRTCQKGYGFLFPTDHLFCIPSKRIRFHKDSETEGPSPTHANVIILLADGKEYERMFWSAFSPIGAICQAHDPR